MNIEERILNKNFKKDDYNISECTHSINAQYAKLSFWHKYKPRWQITDHAAWLDWNSKIGNNINAND